jgi:hypothetical protein
VILKEQTAKAADPIGYVERRREEGVVNSLSRAGAFIVGPAKGTNLPLKALLSNIGFQAIQSYTRREFAESDGLYTDRMNVLIIKTSADRKVWENDCKLIRILRTRRDINVALSPVYVVAEEITQRMVSSFVNAGVDDILVVPSSVGAIRQRMVNSISRPPVFFRTVTYFGPDRRRGIVQKDMGKACGRNGALGPWSNLTIERIPDQGCRILHEQRGDAELAATA